jgi:hypothetical protein
MSLQHIVKNGLKDVSLDVKDINCENITINNAPIELFDQDLNTTDDVRFNQIRLTSTMFTDPDQCVSKQYVDNSAPGLGSLQSAYDGGNTILTAVGFPVELTGTEGVNLNSNPITTGKLTFPNSQELVSRQYVDDAIASIPPSATSLQDAYDGGNTILTQAGNPIELTGPEGITVTKTTFTNPQSLVTKQYVDDATPTVTLQDAYDAGNSITTQAGFPVTIDNAMLLKSASSTQEINFTVPTTAGNNIISTSQNLELQAPVVQINSTNSGKGLDISSNQVIGQPVTIDCKEGDGVTDAPLEIKGKDLKFTSTTTNSQLDLLQLLLIVS